MVKVKGNQELVRQINQSLILDAIRRCGPTSRAEIARVTGLTTGTLSNLTAGLIASGLVTEVGPGASSGGRRPTILQLQASARHTLGVSVGVDYVSVLLLDLTAQPVVRQVAPLGDDKSPGTVADLVAGLAGEVLAAAHLRTSDLLGAAVALPATVDGEAGLVTYSPHLHWHNVLFGPLLADRLGIRPLLENDANASVFGEYWCGTTRGIGDSVFIFADFGIGSGFLVDGRVYRGRDKAAGEFGHTTIDINGPLCHCGNRGCLGMLASGKAIRSKVREALAAGRAVPELAGRPPEQVSLADVMQAARNGDPVCLEAIQEAGRCLGVGIANLINLYNPASLVIGGMLALEAPGYWEAAVAEAGRRLYPVFNNQVHLLLSTLGPDVPAIGAGSLVISQLFRPPQLNTHS